MSRQAIALAIIVLLAGSTLHGAETWHLDKGKDWKAVSAQDKYLTAVTEIKRLVNSGQEKAVRKALEQLKKDFPEITGADLDAFIEAELYYSKGKFVKAVRSYNKFLEKFPESELHEAAVDRQFAIATAFLAGQKKPVLKVFKIKGYAEGEKIMEKIAEREGDSPVAARAAVTIAESLEKRGKYNDAYHKWSEVSSKWPTGDVGRQSLLAMGRCKHAGYRGPKYDSSNLISAKSYYENFRARYSEEANNLDIDRRLAQINEQMAYKQFAIGRYYAKTGNKQSANLYYQMVVDTWPESIAAKMAKRAVESKDIEKEEETWKTKAIKKFEKLFL